MGGRRAGAMTRCEIAPQMRTAQRVQQPPAKRYAAHALGEPARALLLTMTSTWPLKDGSVMASG